MKQIQIHLMELAGFRPASLVTLKNRASCRCCRMIAIERGDCGSVAKLKLLMNTSNGTPDFSASLQRSVCFPNDKPFKNNSTVKGKNLLLRGHTTVELQWLEHLWDYENVFETGVVRRANEC